MASSVCAVVQAWKVAFIHLFHAAGHGLHVFESAGDRAGIYAESGADADRRKDIVNIISADERRFDRDRSRRRGSVEHQSIDAMTDRPCRAHVRELGKTGGDDPGAGLPDNLDPAHVVTVDDRPGFRGETVKSRSLA